MERLELTPEEEEIFEEYYYWHDGNYEPTMEEYYNYIIK